MKAQLKEHDTSVTKLVINGNVVFESPTLTRRTKGDFKMLFCGSFSLNDRRTGNMKDGKLMIVGSGLEL